MAPLRPEICCNPSNHFRGRGGAQFGFCKTRVAETSCPQQGYLRIIREKSAVFPFHHQKMAKWLRFASPIRDVFHEGIDTAVLEVPLRTS